MKVARYYDGDDVRIEDQPVPEPGPGEILVRTRACGICTGDIMSWYMRRKAPLVFGHEPAGEVAALGEGVEQLEIGDRVFVHHHAPCGSCRQCRRGAPVHCPTWRQNGLSPGGLAEYFVAAAPNAVNDTLLLPEGIDFVSASLVEPVACVVKSLTRGAVAPGDTVAVIGAGIMGVLHLLLAKQLGASVVVADMVPARLERARRLGADGVVDVREGTLREGVEKATAGAGADVVIVGPGSLQAMNDGLDAAGPASTVVFFTCSKPGDTLEIDPSRLYFDEISIVPSYSCGPADTRAALEYIRSGVVSADDLVTHRFPLEKTAEALAMAARTDEALKTVVVID